MIVVRLLVVAVLVVVAALALAWLFTGDRRYLGFLGQVVRFSIVLGFLIALLYGVERLVLR